MGGKADQVATVARVHKGKLLTRPGRGFSRAELDAAAIGFDEAKKRRIPFDPRRRTLYESNVSTLKAVRPQSPPELETVKVPEKTR